MVGGGAIHWTDNKARLAKSGKVDRISNRGRNIVLVIGHGLVAPLLMAK